MYLGSVRFFKHTIFLTVLLLIAIPIVFAMRLVAGNSRQMDEITLLNATLYDLQQLQNNILIEENSVNSINHVEAMDVEYPPSLNFFDGLSYQLLYPDMFFDGPWPATNVVPQTAYLTFDDGPSDRTAEILDILNRMDIKASFFVVGQTNERATELMQRIVLEGHTIGAHTYSHNYAKIYSSVESYLDDFYQIFSLIRENTGVSPRLFRFPGGSINAYNARLYREIIAEMLRRGFIFYDWNVSSEDASSAGIGKEQIRHNVLADSEGKIRSFVLLHDSSRHINTVNALEDIISDLQSKGFRIDRLTEDVKPIAFAYHSE
jgi:peptidoglycan/xylan/chitin deacetylase (PgdA/CDA1 family)